MILYIPFSGLVSLLNETGIMVSIPFIVMLVSQKQTMLLEVAGRRENINQKYKWLSSANRQRVVGVTGRTFLPQLKSPVSVNSQPRQRGPWITVIETRWSPLLSKEMASPDVPISVSLILRMRMEGWLDLGMHQLLHITIPSSTSHLSDSLGLLHETQHLP